MRGRRAAILAAVAAAALVLPLLLLRPAPSPRVVSPRRPPAGLPAAGGVSGPSGPATGNAARGSSAAYAGEDAATVHGGVFSASDGRPLPGANLRVTTPAGAFLARTDASGAFSLVLPAARPGFQGGGYTFFPSWPVTVKAPGHLPLSTGLGTGAASNPARFVLHPVFATLSGMVLSPDGDPVSGARLRIDDRAWTSRADGSYGPVPLALGRSDLRVRSPRFAPIAVLLVVLPADETREIRRDLVLAAGAAATGRVVDDAGAPVAGVRFLERHGGARLATSAADGRFRIVLPHGGSEEVRIVAAGYAFPEREAELTAGRESTVRVWRPGFLAGRLLDVGGSPATGVALFAIGEPGGYEVDDTTDAGGTFHLGPLPPGRISVRAMRGGIPLGTFRDVRLPGPGTTGGVTLRLPDVAPVRCRVVDATTGRPVEGVEVRLRPEGTEPPVTRSDASGAFSIRAAGPGTLFLRKDGCVTRFVHTNGGSDEQTFELYRAGRFQLRAVDAEGRPVAFARATWRATAATGNRWDTQDAAGENGVLEGELPAGLPVEVRVFPGSATVTLTVRPGEVRNAGDLVLEHVPNLRTIHVTDEAGKPLPEAFAFDGRRIYWADANGRIACPSGRVTISAPGRERRTETMPAEEMALAEATEIAGHVVDTEGLPVANALVSDGRWSPGTTDGSGRFVLAGRPRGEVVRLETGSVPGYWEETEAYATAGDRDVRLVLPRTGRIRVRLAAPAGAARPQAVELRGVREGPGAPAPLEFGAEATLDRDGYAASVPAGRLRVSFDLPGLPARIWEAVDVPPGGETVLVYAPKRPGRLLGLVTDDRRRPIANAEVFAIDGGLDRCVATTDADGRMCPFEEGAVVGTSRLLVVDGDHAPVVTDAVDLAKGASFDVVLLRGGDVSGRVRDGEFPVSAAVVRLVDPDLAGGGETRTDSRGRFDFDVRIPPGRRILEITAPGRAPFRRAIEVADDEDLDLDIPLPE